MYESNAILNTIDFLPERYREAKMKRHAKLWRLLLAMVFAAMLSSAAFYEQRLLWHARAELTNVQAMHATAAGTSKALGEEQVKLQATEQEAELLAYLRHPWPRTQILNAVFTPLPDSARLSSFQLSYTKRDKPVAEASQTVSAETADKTPSPARDLKHLRDEFDEGRWHVLLSGSTTDVAQLHIYVAALESNKLFTQVELLSIDSPSAAEHNRARFALRLTLKPGYGQPDGPSIDSRLQAMAAAKEGYTR